MRIWLPPRQRSTKVGCHRCSPSRCNRRSFVKRSPSRSHTTRCLWKRAVCARLQMSRQPAWNCGTPGWRHSSASVLRNWSAPTSVCAGGCSRRYACYWCCSSSACRTAPYKAVARLAGRLAERAQQPAEKVRAIQAAALIHDIGLVSLPDLLLRPGLVPMTRRVEYERHAILGQQMLSSVDELGEMAGWIRHHHERWDGAGYPDRLAGPAIPFPSQIIAIAAGFNDALAREGGSAASWRWTQTEAGEFDPLLIEYLDDEISARPNPSSLDTEAGSSNLRPTSQSAPGVSPGGLIHSARSAQESNEFDFSVMPMRRLRSGMVLAESISTPAGITLLRMGETLTDSQIERLRRLVTEGKVNDDEMVSVLIR